MAAYAALVSLMNTIQNIHNNSRLSNSIDKSQIESLGEKLDFLLEFVENRHSHGGYREAENLESQIATVAHAAEDAIESHIVDRIEPLMDRSTTFDHEERRSRLLLDFLLNMMQLIQNHPSLLTTFDSKQIGSLDFLLDFIDNRSSHVGSKEFLENQIESEVPSIRSQLQDRFASDAVIFISADGRMSSRAYFDQLVFYMEQMLNHPRFWTSLEGKDFEDLENYVYLLQYFTDTTYNSDGILSEREVDDLETQIGGSSFDHGESSSCSMKDINAMKKKVIKVHRKIFGKKVVLVGTENSFLPNLQKVLEDMDSLKERVLEIKAEWKFKDVLPTYSMPAASSRSLTTEKTSVVGFEGYSLQLLDWLTTQQSDQQIIPITGMGGIGKTTLATKVYKNSLVVQHFDVCAWLTLSQEYNVRELLSHTLSRLGKTTKELDKKTEDELGVLLHKSLYGRRYLIILDDMWSIESWNKIMFYFPTVEKGSRIVVTTRQLDVANHFGCLRLALDFLDDNKSWDLFCKKAFEQGCCPSELESIGRKIIKKCKGLPLSIVVIGGLLGKSSRTQEHWKSVVKDLSSIMNSAEENQCFNILYLSYSYLPAHLKPCFLYLGLFPEDLEFRVSQLTKLWVAEGFLKPNKESSMEKVGKGYIEDLVDRNLLLVRYFGLDSKVTDFSIHDLLRDLCIKVAEKEKFFCLMKEHESPQAIGGERRLLSFKSIEEERSPLQSTSLVRPISREYHCNLSSKSRLLRVFSDAHAGYLDTTFQKVNLRFLECPPNSHNSIYNLPLSIPLLWNLQTLIIEGRDVTVVAPLEIWEMQQLRHLRFLGVHLPMPPPSEKQDRIVLRNLRTLGVAVAFKWSEEFLQRMPNIKKLSISFGPYLLCNDDAMTYGCFRNVGRLDKLESLHFDAGDGPRGLLHNFKLPDSLKKLSLTNCQLNREDLTRIGSLPHLEVLRLSSTSVQAPEWSPIEGEFLRLRYLQISECYDLIRWSADSSHFPVLERLLLENLWKLDEIPLGIGDIPTLQNICLWDCSASAVISAVNMLKEQESVGNEGLRVGVFYANMGKLGKQAREKVVLELEGFTSNNFVLI